MPFTIRFFQNCCLFFGIAVAFATSAGAHEAKTGWKYPYACCSDRDCREVADELISPMPEGYRIELNGEQLSYADTRIRPSPDGVYHWCSADGRDDTRTICLFVPPQAF